MRPPLHELGPAVVRLRADWAVVEGPHELASESKADHHQTRDPHAPHHNHPNPLLSQHHLGLVYSSVLTYP